MQKTLYFEFNIERERRVTQILHSVQGAHLQQNWQGWRLHTGNSQHLPSWQGQWWVFGSPWTASFSLWAAVLFHWTATGWRLHLCRRSRPRHPCSLWLWCCWLGRWAFSQVLWGNREYDWLRVGLRHGATLLSQSSQPLTAHSELCKGHQSKVLTFAEEQLCTFGWQYVRRELHLLSDPI